MQDSNKKSKVRLAMLQMKTDTISHKHIFLDEKPKRSSRDNVALDSKPLTIVFITVAQASFVSSKPKIELDLHANRCVIDDNF